MINARVAHAAAGLRPHLDAAAGSSNQHTTDLLIQLGAILFALGLLGRLAKLVKIPVIPLYLLGGLAFGQGGLVSLSASADFIRVSAEIGVILLLLMLGLEYSADELLANVRSQAPVGLFDAVINAGPGVAVAWIAGWGIQGAVALGGITWVSSSGVIAKLLSDQGRLGNRETPSILGVLVVEDLSMAIYLPLLTALLAGKGLGGVVLAVVIALVAVSVVLIVATRLGVQVTRLVSSDDAESLLLGTLGLTLLVAGVAQQLQVSSAVGAFLVGIAVSGTVAESAVEVLTPLRDLFAAAFFVFFGLSTPPHTLVAVLPLAVALAVVGTATKLTTGYVAARRDGAQRRGRWRAAVGLVPRGEFSVVVAALAVNAGAQAKLGPLTAAYVLLTIVIAGLIGTLPDRLNAKSKRQLRAQSPAAPPVVLVPSDPVG